MNTEPSKRKQRQLRKVFVRKSTATKKAVLSLATARTAINPMTGTKDPTISKAAPSPRRSPVGNLMEDLANTEASYRKPLPLNQPAHSSVAESWLREPVFSSNN